MAFHRKATAHGSKHSRRDLYQEVTDRIVAALADGVAPWVRPWRSLGAAGDLRNGATGYAYNGVNVMLLGLEMDARGYDDPRWVTYRQAKQQGGHVRKGEKGSLVIFWKRLLVADKDDADRTRVVPMLRHYSVFNVDQCEGLELAGESIDELPEPERDARCETFLGATRADIRHGGSRAFYSRRPLDYIQLPHAKAFKDIGAYYGTAFHELTHWTGDEDRSPRAKGKRFGDEDYAREELVAELGSSYLCHRFAVDGTLQHPEYIADWLQTLRNDKRAIFQAASRARQACEYLYGVAGWDDSVGRFDGEGDGSERNRPMVAA